MLLPNNFGVFGGGLAHGHSAVEGAEVLSSAHFVLRLGGAH